MKKLLGLLSLLLFSTAAHAAPTCNYWMTDGCSYYTKGLSDVMNMKPIYYTLNSGTYEAVDVEFSTWTWTEFQTGGPPDVNISSLPTILINAVKDLNNQKFANPTGTTSQYIRGDGSLATFAVPAKSISYPTRTLNSCFQISSTRDADFHYSVDVTAALVLGGGTATTTSYTNSSCTTGAQVMRDGTVSGVVAGGTTSVNLDGTLGSNKWMKITTASTGLGATVALRTAQQEVLH